MAFGFGGAYDNCMKEFRHYLASANTGLGFVDNFDSILENDGKGYCYIIKGGSGTGKSTMLHKIAEHFENLGYEIEFFHCSSDFNSLDGVRIVELNVSVIDGTAPHTKDAGLPSINAEIVNVGEFIGRGVAKHKAQIEKLVKLKGENYKQIYSYLAICKGLEDIVCNEFKREFNAGEFESEVEKILCDLNLHKQKLNASERHLFLDYVGENGIESTFNKNKYQSILKLNFNAYQFGLFYDRLAKVLKNLNYNFIAFHSVIDNNVKAVYIKNIDLIICYEENCKSTVVAFNRKLQKQILAKVSTILKETKKLHKGIEKYYIANVDFNGVNGLTEKLINKIVKFA